MKKIKELLTVAICALLVISPVMTETVSAAGMKESVADFTSGMRSGWVQLMDESTREMESLSKGVRK